MKKLKMTITVFIDDEMAKPLESLYEHVCEWEGNTEGTVEVEMDEIIEDAIIGE